uniref:General transcription and DNA repair factor IIH subunit TFB5 n=1 Tax=Brassica campestris TaxID=3711 RepID=M4DJU6_BRACM
MSCVMSSTIAQWSLSFSLVCLADLEFDYINPYDSASRINSVVLPEFIIQGVLCVFYLLTRHWFMSLLCLPYLFYNFQLYSKRQHLVDVTEIFNLLNWEKKKRLFKLAYIILNLFLTIFWLKLIVNMNNSMPSSQRFIIHVLDSTHLFVQPHVEQMIRSAIAEFRNQNSYEKPT